VAVHPASSLSLAAAVGGDGAVRASVWFEALGAPVPCARARVVGARGKTHAFTPRKTAEFEQLVRLVAMTAVGKMDGWRTDWPAYRFELVVYRAERRGDWDNFARPSRTRSRGSSSTTIARSWRRTSASNWIATDRAST
jgi:hypothetical protein